jgi:hypothetical protein
LFVLGLLILSTNLPRALCDEKQDAALKAAKAELRAELAAEYRANERKLKQRVKANPRDVAAWRVLGWNAAYNLSTTSDDVKERYSHVKQGIEYLVTGVENNPMEVRLLWDVAWYVCHKIGLAAEQQEYRKLFAKDAEFHKLLKPLIDVRSATGPGGTPDSLQAARLLFEKVIASLEKQRTLDRFAIAQEIVYAEPARCQMRYAAQIASEGHIDDAARSWKEAQKMWEALGDRELSQHDGSKYRVKDSERARRLVNYDYWMKRCRLEQTEAVLEARQSLHRAAQLTARKPAVVSTTAEARRSYEQGVRAWADIHKANPWLNDDDDLERELAAMVRRYKADVLQGQDLPKDFPLRHPTHDPDK